MPTSNLQDVSAPLEGDHVFVLPYASCLSTFQAPGWGIPAVFPPCHRGNATPWELVPFSHRSASRIFIMRPGCTPPPAVTQDGDLQFDDRGKQIGPRPLPLPHAASFDGSVPVLLRTPKTEPAHPACAWGCSSLRLLFLRGGRLRCV